MDHLPPACWRSEAFAEDPSDDGGSAGALAGLPAVKTINGLRRALLTRLPGTRLRRMAPSAVGATGAPGTGTQWPLPSFSPSFNR